MKKILLSLSLLLLSCVSYAGYGVTGKSGYNAQYGYHTYSTSTVVAAPGSYATHTDATYPTLARYIYFGAPADWTSSTNTYTADDKYAQYIYTGTSQVKFNGHLELSGYGFTIPSSSTITGLNVTVNFKYTGAINSPEKINVFLNSENYFTPYNITVSSNSGYYYSTTINITTNTLTAAIVNNSSWYIGLQAVSTGTLSIDCMTVQVLYNSTSAVTTASGAVKLPTSAANINNGSLTNWQNVNNAFSQIDSSACASALFNADTTTTSQPILKVSGFGLNVPSGATIDGVLITCRYNYPDGVALVNPIYQLSYGINNTKLSYWINETDADDMSMAFNTRTAGSSGNKLFYNVTAAEINDPNFAVYVIYGGDDYATISTLAVDWVTVQVYYH